MADTDIDKNDITTIYYASTMLFDGVDDMIDLSRHRGSSSFFSNLQDQCSIIGTANLDHAYEAATEKAMKVVMPAYVYSITLKNTDKFLDSSKPIPQNKIELLSKLLLEKEYDQDGLDNITKKSTDDLIRAIEHNFSYEQAIHIMQSIGIDGTYDTTLPNSSPVHIFNKDLILDIKHEQIMSAVDENSYYFNLETNNSPQDRLERMLSDFDKHGQNERLSYIHAVKNDPIFQVSMLRKIQTEFNQYSSKQLLEDIDNSPSLNRKKKTVFNHTNIPSKNCNALPKNLDELSDLTDATSMHVSAEHLKAINGGTNTATKIKFRESDHQLFVTKELDADKSDACRSEFEAYQIYEAFGVKTPKVQLIEEENRTILIMEHIDGRTLNEHITHPEDSTDTKKLQILRDKVAEDYAIDALICNPDTGFFHDDNILIDTTNEEQNIYRIDMGYALEYHAYGGKKDSDEWATPHIDDFDDFRKKRGAINFGGIDNQKMLDRILQAEKDMPKVKDVARPETYKIIEQRLNMALSHYSKICDIEQSFQENKSSICPTPITAPQPITQENKQKTLKNM